MSTPTVPEEIGFGNDQRDPQVKRRRQLVLLVSLISLLGAVPSLAQTPGVTPTPTPTPSPSPTPTPTPAAATEDTLQRDVEGALQRIQQAQEETRNQISTILSMMEAFLGFLGVALSIVGIIVAGVIGVLSFLGFREWRDIKTRAKKAEEFSKKAEAAAQKAQEVQTKAEETEKRLDAAMTAAEKEVQLISDWRSSLSSAWADINAHFQELPILESEEVDGVEMPPIPIEISSTFEDRDVILMLCDQLKIPADKTKSAEYFLKLACYWRLVKNYPRAIARVERAVDLAPDLSDARRDLARTLTHWAETLPDDSSLRRERLKRALKVLEETRARLQEEDESLLFELAYTHDILGEFEAAAELYRKARTMDQEQAVAANQEEYWYLTYNLACSLSLAGKLEEAFAEVTLFLERWPDRWKLVQKDPHLRRIRETSPWKEKLQDFFSKAGSEGGD